MRRLPPSPGFLTRRAPSRYRWPLAALIVLTVALAACGSSGAAVHDSFGPTSGPKLEPGPTYEVKVANVGGIGPVLVTGQGLTLYRIRARPPVTVDL